MAGLASGEFNTGIFHIEDCGRNRDVIARWFNLSADPADLHVQTGFECVSSYESDVLERVQATFENNHRTVAGYKIVTQGYELV